MSADARDMRSFWKGRKVLVTGHTGFKGGWLSMTLSWLGANLRGYSLPPPSSPSLYNDAGVGGVIPGRIGDVRDGRLLREAVDEFSPEIVFHLAAQPIVREAYRSPLLTLDVNIMGTANVLEACRLCGAVRAVVNVTTDKCYENQEGRREPFREDDKLGGSDPYSASKACSEILTASYQRSFFAMGGARGAATARSGNVIGGGDWAADRLIPDLFRAACSGATFVVRNPGHVRPWQHVLDSVDGYLSLARALREDPARFSGAWNFGPPASEFKPVRHVVERVMRKWGAPMSCKFESDADLSMPEAAFLSLDTSKALGELGWSPRLDLEKASDATVEWYKNYLREGAAATAGFTMAQIRNYYGEP